ncbi:15663_t:CDS:1 [Funneliformis geosporum]|uniref:DNA-directed DNA polymerase n=1 Tax=Funneliformis geosporum TaxID=1117311 RepID=A0A9W4WV88_9GLOM|nr:3920_t:CDS:1 [Funneliformis geosporum]CAI2176764.1 15663_t:CDS:1 [Funneliformis geosporum]
MKVCNLLGAYAFDRGMLISMIPWESSMIGKYPGAYVLPPCHGLENKRPVTGLNFTSLYPSIIMAYNLSPEKIITDPCQLSALSWEKYDTHHIDFALNGQKIEGWVIRHDDIEKNMGLYPRVLIDLFQKRAKVKAQFNALAKMKEQIELLQSRASLHNISLEDALFRLLDEKEKEVQNIETHLSGALNHLYENNSADELSFRKKKLLELVYGWKYLLQRHVVSGYMCANFKQSALKIYMNTFYGEAGNSISPFFFLHLARGVTSAGQDNLKDVASYVGKLGFGIKYGDTDSLYLTCPHEIFKECDAMFGSNALSKLEYWNEMVRITMQAMDDLRNKVNIYLIEKSKSTFLKMAYEEVLFPVVFTGKKKYFGMPHEHFPNFHSNKLFIKGIDIVKQGRSKLFKDIGDDIMRKALSIKNETSLLDIVQNVLANAINSTDWNFDDFIQTDA